jgi:hypothetical protein
MRTSFDARPLKLVDDYECIKGIGTNYSKQLDKQMKIESHQRKMQEKYSKDVDLPRKAHDYNYQMKLASD